VKKELLIAALGIGVSGTLDATTRQEVEALLDEVAKRQITEKTVRDLDDAYKNAHKNMLAMTASCYWGGPQVVRAEYNCPVCSEKTIHSTRERVSGDVKDAKEIEFPFLKYRRQCEELRSLDWDVTLDSTFLCSKCRKPNQPEEFFIEVTIDGKTTRTKMDENDLGRLIAFARKDEIWTGKYGEGKPIKNSLPRIHKLLGVSEEKQK